MTALNASDRSFDEVALGGAADCLILFGVGWSVTGRRMAERARRVAGRHAMASLAIDADAAPELARRLQVAAAPSLLLFRNGQEVDRRIGELGEHDLEEWLTLALAE